MSMLTLSEMVELRKLLAQRTDELKVLQTKLTVAERNCKHDWLPTKHTTAQKTEYWPRRSSYNPHDMYGSYDTVYVSIPAWERTCKSCGKVETTIDTQDVVTKVPKF